MLHRNLVRLRTNAGLTQQELSDAAGVSRSTVARIESNRQSPGVETLTRLADALGVTLDHLTGGVE